MTHLLQLLLLLSVILVTSKYAGALSIRIGQPAVFGKIALGLILGPTILDILSWHIGGFYFFGGWPSEHFVSGIEGLHGSAQNFTDIAFATQAAKFAESGPILYVLKDMAEIGVILLMFMAGVETDLPGVMKVGKVAFWAAVGGVIAPMISAFFASELFGKFGLHFSGYEALFIGTVLTATSVSISAQTLMELGKLKSKEGSTILGAAVIDDVIGIIVLSFVIAFKPANPGEAATAPGQLLDWIMQAFSGGAMSDQAVGLVRIGILVVMMVAFFLVAIKAEKWFIEPLLRRFERLPITEGLLAGTLLIGFLYAWGAEWIGNVAAITGSYTAGVLISRNHALKEAIEEKLHTITYSFFVPIFFISIGMEANAKPIFAPLAHIGSMTKDEWLMFSFTVVIVLLAILAKVLGCLIGSKLTGFSWLESYKVGVGMISRGEVGIIVALVGLNAGIIDKEVFSIMILMVLATTLVTPIWLKAVFKGENGKNGKGGGELPAPTEA
jgi:Kef-type K+ transport system membrane component KefB